MGLIAGRDKWRSSPCRWGRNGRGASSENQNDPDGAFCFSGGEGGIRTHEGQLTLAGFQDQCIQPLCHLSTSCLRSNGTSTLTRCVPAARPAGAFALLMRPKSFRRFCQPLCHLSMRRRILRAGWHCFNRDRPIMVDLGVEFGCNGRKSRDQVSRVPPEPSSHVTVRHCNGR
jgi:hypothetical protein